MDEDDTLIEVPRRNYLRRHEADTAQGMRYEPGIELAAHPSMREHPGIAAWRHSAAPWRDHAHMWEESARFWRSVATGLVIGMVLGLADWGLWS